MKSLNKKQYIILIVIALLSVPLFFIKTQYTIKVTGTINPKNEFHIILKQNNDIKTVQTDALKGRADRTQIFIPDRGDITSIELNQSINLGSNISVGDTVAVIKSKTPNFINHVITSPLKGIVNQSTNSDTLLTISDLSILVAIFPIQTSNISLVETDQEVYIELLGNDIKGNIKNIDKTVHFFDGREYSLVLIEIDNITDNILLNKTITGRFGLGKQSLANQIIKYLN